MDTRSTHPRPTPLSRLLDAPARPRKVTPLDAFKLARTRWLAGERIDVGRLARELGIGRATVFRWVGTRENLYGEVISQLFARVLARAQAEARGAGVARLLDMLARLLHALAGAPPLRRFVAEDPEFALRVLMSRHSPVQYRCTVAVRDQLDALVAAGELAPALPTDELAYIIVRVTESFLCRDVIDGADADIDAALRAIRILLAARPSPSLRAPASARRRRRGR